MTVSAVAGTFSVIHDGHRALISEAFARGDSVIVGLTTDGFALQSRRDVVPYHLRKSALESYLKGFSKPFQIFPLDAVCGSRGLMDAVDLLVVSEETEANGLEIAEGRIHRGVKPLQVLVVPLKKASDGSKISSTAILEGRYSRSGSADCPDIAVGSVNHVKVEAVRTVMERIYGDVRITAVDVPSGVPEQPRESATRDGAVNRATAALGNHDMSVGIEAGVFERIDGLIDIQFCAVLDRDGRLTVGTGPGFQYPPPVASMVRGGMTVGQAMKSVFGETDIGHRQGAVGFLSKGLLDRKTLTEQAVTAAMIPRLDDSYV